MQEEEKRADQEDVAAKREMVKELPGIGHHDRRAYTHAHTRSPIIPYSSDSGGGGGRARR